MTLSRKKLNRVHSIEQGQDEAGDATAADLPDLDKVSSSMLSPTKAAAAATEPAVVTPPLLRPAEQLNLEVSTTETPSAAPQVVSSKKDRPGKREGHSQKKPHEGHKSKGKDKAGSAPADADLTNLQTTSSSMMTTTKADVVVTLPLLRPAEQLGLSSTTETPSAVPQLVSPNKNLPSKREGGSPKKLHKVHKSKEQDKAGSAEAADLPHPDEVPMMTPAKTVATKADVVSPPLFNPAEQLSLKTTAEAPTAITQLVSSEKNQPTSGDGRSQKEHDKGLHHDKLLCHTASAETEDSANPDGTLSSMNPGAVTVGAIDGVRWRPPSTPQVTGQYDAATDPSLQFEPQIVAFLAPEDDNQAEERIAQRVEARLRRQLDEGEVIVADEVHYDSSKPSRLNKRMVGLLSMVFILAVIGAVVGGVLSSRNRGGHNDPTPRPTSAPTMTLDPIVQQYRGWIAPTDDDLEPFWDPTSPQSQALAWLKDDPITMATPTSPTTVLERYALAVLYFATSGPNWVLPLLSEEDVCDWNNGLYTQGNRTGVYCSTSGTVNALELNEHNLRGPMPWELVLLNDLAIIDFDKNQISGRIPARLGELTSLEVFWVTSNDFTGPLPASFPSSIWSVDLSGNAFTGSIPESYATSLPNLEALYLYANRLNGTIPSQFGDTISLNTFYFFMNSLTGSVDGIFCDGRNWEALVADCNEVICPCCTSCCDDNRETCR